MNLKKIKKYLEEREGLGVGVAELVNPGLKAWDYPGNGTFISSNLLKSDATH